MSLELILLEVQICSFWF